MTEEGRKTPKEYFLTKLYSAMKEFEDMTGTEIHNIKIHRYPVDDMGAAPKTIAFKYDLDIK